MYLCCLLQETPSRFQQSFWMTYLERLQLRGQHILITRMCLNTCRQLTDWWTRPLYDIHLRTNAFWSNPCCLLTKCIIRHCQVCLAAVLAHAGCYVPAKSLRLTPVDAIFVRMGARDSIVSGQVRGQDFRFSTTKRYFWYSIRFVMHVLLNITRIMQSLCNMEYSQACS